MTTSHTEIRSLPLELIVLSQSSIQIERRAQFDEDALNEMSVTIKSNGRVEQPIMVRPLVRGGIPSGSFEVADGERRVISSARAGLSEILAEVRDLTDEQVEEIQIVTGLQKEKLHELVEAEGYEVLHKRGLSIEEIATKCAKSPATVYARMKLLALCEEARAAVRRGKISASVGLLIARIGLAKLQKEALQAVGPDEERGLEAISYREASQYIQRTFMLRLDQAPFDVADATLIKKAGPCGACPKNSASQPELFADVSSGAMCTDQVCFAAKKSAHVNRQLNEAKGAGQLVIRGKDADRIAPHGNAYNLEHGWVALHEVSARLKPDAKIALLQLPNDPDRVVKVVLRKDVKQKPAASASRKPADEPPNRKPDPEEEVQKRLYLAVHAKAPKKMSQQTLVALANVFVDDTVGYDANVLFEAWGWKDVPSQQELKALKEQQLHQLLFELMLFSNYAEPHLMEETAKRLGIDAKKIRAEVKASLVALAPAKASKKKAAKK